MDCPRCGGRLVTFTIEASDQSASVCESCGFADVSATHRTDHEDVDSWDQAIDRFGETNFSPATASQTDRTEVVSAPPAESDQTTDLDQLVGSVSVAVSLRKDTEDETG
jgi:transcription elongation factor Elf1